MCFLEFLGFTCGHISLPVLRPCPLTTASHTYPTCPRRADRPFLAGEMCPSCQKIVHSRATQIEEYEHRFMHERGVCGCETIFPYLIRPRVIGGGNHVADDTDAASTSASAAAAAVPPLLCEAVDAGGKSVVAVRLPSLYAAEWVADHGERHAAGLCDCRVDLRTYGQARDDDDDDAAFRQTPYEGLYRAPPAVPALRRVVSLPVMPPVDDDEDDSCTKHTLRRSSSHEILATGRLDWQEEVASARVLPAGQPVRDSGAVFTKVPVYLPVTGPFLGRPTHDDDDDSNDDSNDDRNNDDRLPVVDGVLDDAGEAAVQHHVQQAMDRTPLLGFPIGAGPEGVSHAAPWHGKLPCYFGGSEW